MKAVDGVLLMQTRETEAAFDGTAAARLQFAVNQRFQSFSEAVVFGDGVSDRLIQLTDHRGQAELVEFLMQSVHGTLSGTKNESVVLGERKRIGGEFIQGRIAQMQRRLHIAPLLLLTEDVADVIGVEGARGMSPGDRVDTASGPYSRMSANSSRTCRESERSVSASRARYSCAAGPSRAMGRCCVAERSAAAICERSSFSKRSAPRSCPRCQEPA
jgi:hypothetical protein